MMSDLPLVDQVWMFSLVIALIVMCLTILVLLGPQFVRDVVGIFRTEIKGEPAAGVFTRLANDARDRRAVEALARDADIQELR